MIELHNVWQVMLADATEDEPGLAMIGRPQDWGDPKWHYKTIVVQVEIDGKTYHNTAHIWFDMPMKDGDLMGLGWFRELAFTIQYPGENPKLCGRDYLEPEDFWLDEWGEVPEVFDAEADDYEPYLG